MGRYEEEGVGRLIAINACTLVSIFFLFSPKDGNEGNKERKNEKMRERKK